MEHGKLLSKLKASSHKQSSYAAEQDTAEIADKAM